MSIVDIDRMCNTSMSKLSILVLVLILAFITNAQASCSRWGHACWGGHGKRSGGGSSWSSSSSSPSGDGIGIRNREGENRKVLNRISWGNSNVGPPEMNGSPTFTFPDPLSSSPVDSGFDDGSRGSASLHSIPSTSFGNGIERDQIVMQDTNSNNNNRRDEGDQDVAMEEVYDYSQSAESDSSKQPTDQTRHDYYDQTFKIASSEDTKPSDMRKTPKNNLFLYKLIRIH